MANLAHQSLTGKYPKCPLLLEIQHNRTLSGIGITTEETDNAIATSVCVAGGAGVAADDKWLGHVGSLTLGCIGVTASGIAECHKTLQGSSGRP